MKRIILLAACLLAASACTSTPESNNANTAPVNTNATTSANTTASPNAEAGDVSSNVISQEKQIWDTIKNKNYDGVVAMLTDDFIYVAPEAVYDKAGTIKSLKGFEPTDLSFSDWKVLMLDKDAAVVYYNVAIKGKSDGKPMDTNLRASSAWVNRGGKWVGIYHQECEVKPPPPPPPASTKPAAKASPGTTASMPAACGNDDAV